MTTSDIVGLVIAALGGAVVAATAIAIGVLMNTVMKLGVALFCGSRGFKTITGSALLLMLLTLAIALVYGRSI
jgi:hypothetical protein